MTARAIYYGSDTLKMLGPYHPDEIAARQRAKAALGSGGHDVYEIMADSREEARTRLIGAIR